MKKENIEGVDNKEQVEQKPKVRKRGRPPKKSSTTKTSTRKKITSKPKEVKNDIKPISLKESYGYYLKDGHPFRIYLNSQVIYDSEKQKINVEFLEDYFILGDEKYEYKGIKVEKYNK